MEPRPMERFCFATIIVATLMLHGFEPLPCRAQTASPPPPAPLPPALPHRRNSASPAGERLRDREAEASTARADRPSLSDQPRHRLAALRRPAADRGRRPGQRLGGRGAAHTGQGPLGSSTQHRLRLHPPRRRRPGLQQGHHDRAERQLLLRRCRPVADPGLDRCRLRAPGRAAGPEFPAMGHPDRQERRPAHDRRCLLPGAPVSGNVCRRPLRRRAGARPGRADRALEQGPGPQGRGRSGQEHARRPRAAGRPRRARRGACTAPT